MQTEEGKILEKIKGLKGEEWNSLEVDTRTFYVLSGYVMDCLVKSVKKADSLAMKSLRRDYLNIFEGGDDKEVNPDRVRQLWKKVFLFLDSKDIIQNNDDENSEFKMMMQHIYGNDDELLQCKKGQAVEWVVVGNVAGKKIDGFKY